MHIRAFLVSQQPNTMQLVSMRMRTGDIDVRQTEVEMRRHAQRSKRLRRASGKTATPQGDVRFGLRHEVPPGSVTTMLSLSFKNIRDADGPPKATRQGPHHAPSPTSR